MDYVQNTGNDSMDIVRVDSSGASPAFFGTGGSGFGGLHDVGNISDLALGGAPQAGSATLVDTGQGHVAGNSIQSAIWQNNILYAVAEIRNSGARDVVHWFRFDASNVNNVTLLNQGDIDYGAGTSTYYGSLAVDNAGNMTIGFNFSNATSIDPSSAYITIAPDGSHDTGFFLTAGGGPLTEFGARYGDYSGTAIDPLNRRSFWVFGENATASNTWATTVGG